MSTNQENIKNLMSEASKIDSELIVKNKEKIENNREVLKFDLLKLYFREPYIIKTPGAKNIVIKQPSVGDIVSFGEEEFYKTVLIFITNTTSNRLMLWEKGIDWNTFSDYELFLRNLYNSNPDVVNLIFENLDVKSIIPLKKKDEDNVIVLYDRTNDIMIDENVYEHIAQYLRKMFNIFPKVEKTTSQVTKESIIEEEIFSIMAKQFEKKSGSMLFPLISACVNHPGFKYKSSELKEIGIFEFMDSTKRLQVYESATAVLKGMCSGFVDGKNIKESQYNFMKEIN